jgi:hypothetical protein
VREECAARRPQTFGFSGLDPCHQLRDDPRVDLVLAAGKSRASR